jgi:hypothetical protein
MKKIGAILILILVAAVVGISGCTTDSNGNNTTTTKNYSANGYTFEYPSDWTLDDSSVNSSNIVMIYKGSSQVTIQKMALNGMSEAAAIKTIKNTVFPSYLTSVSNDTLTIGNTTAYRYVFTGSGNNSSEQMKYSFIYLIKGDNEYIITLQAPEGQFDGLKANFNTIVNSFKTQ